jgi:cysteine sulfinate desulfinase/cysteine desulfurase-like protein
MAIGLSEKDARSSLRFSLSDTNSEKEIEKLGEVIANVVTRSRATFVNQSKLNTQKTNLVNAK